MKFPTAEEIKQGQAAFSDYLVLDKETRTNALKALRKYQIQYRDVCQTLLHAAQDEPSYIITESVFSFIAGFLAGQQVKEPDHEADLTHAGPRRDS